MTILYEPSKLLKKYAPNKKIKRLITNNLTINKMILKTISELDFVSKKQLDTIVLKTIRTYKNKFKELKKDGTGKAKSLKEAVNNKKLLENRVKSVIRFQMMQEIKTKYEGEFYRWLPSSADTPDPDHQLKYGEIYQVGVGEMPNERHGCQCGMEILVDENKLVL